MSFSRRFLPFSYFLPLYCISSLSLNILQLRSHVTAPAEKLTFAYFTGKFYSPSLFLPWLFHLGHTLFPCSSPISHKQEGVSQTTPPTTSLHQHVRGFHLLEQKGYEITNTPFSPFSKWPSRFHVVLKGLSCVVPCRATRRGHVATWELLTFQSKWMT